jgi:ABC-type Mn2+/Zn2+ transport system ATPase subunit
MWFKQGQQTERYTHLFHKINHITVMQGGTLHTLLLEMIHEVHRPFNDSCLLQQISGGKKQKIFFARHKDLKVENSHIFE